MGKKKSLLKLFVSNETQNCNSKEEKPEEMTEYKLEEKIVEEEKVDETVDEKKEETVREETLEEETLEEETLEVEEEKVEVEEEEETLEEETLEEEIDNEPSTMDNPFFSFLSEFLQTKATMTEEFLKKQSRRYSLYFIALEDNNMFLYLSYRKTNDKILYQCEHLYDYPKLYKPIEVVSIMDDCELTDADKYVKIFMRMFGEDSVRGGSYTDIILPEWQKKTLQQEFDMASIEKLDEIERYFKNLDTTNS